MTKINQTQEESSESETFIDTEDNDAYKLQRRISCIKLNMVAGCLAEALCFAAVVVLYIEDIITMRDIKSIHLVTQIFLADTYLLVGYIYVFRKLMAHYNSLLVDSLETAMSTPLA